MFFRERIAEPTEVNLEGKWRYHERCGTSRTTPVTGKFGPFTRSRYISLALRTLTPVVVIIMPYSEETAGYRVSCIAYSGIVGENQSFIGFECFDSSTTPCCGSKIPKFHSLSTQM